MLSKASQGAHVSEHILLNLSLNDIYHNGDYKGFHIGVKFLAPASSSEFFIPVYCAEDTMVRPHTFIITASQGERTLFGTIFLCTALSYQVSEREQILINS